MGLWRAVSIWEAFRKAGKPLQEDTGELREEQSRVRVAEQKHGHTADRDVK